MQTLPASANKLIEELSRLPGIGKKTAQRLAFHILKVDTSIVYRLSDSLKDVKNKVRSCSSCGGITEEETCVICNDPKRDNNQLCIVEDAPDIYVFERTNIFKGTYHVLGGALSPLDGIGPDELNMDRLMDRIEPGMEIVIATNPTVEGETTALYISKKLSDSDVKVTRLARGIPVGGDLEYTDEATLIRAMEGRTLF
ncbi:MAG: recombination mediator RecR [Candidatus Marinimicrobia bacterium]|nr:recombination mediator RecR [Candidatus Neomarinimicrobiota bacterium]HJM33545.1 recombination mediator RecR [Candidatus Neomarinimicrobiota bacterium]HJM95962.1 recombination mediator RecR [Candidatus Neomarinimicrobiota bacterium]